MVLFQVNDYVKELTKAGILVEENISSIYNKKVKKITYNSKEVSADTLFICKGATFKEEYLIEAEKKGAMVYISEGRHQNLEIPYILVNNIRKAMAIISGIYYGNPSEKLKVIGITGTKGKSTTAYFLKSIFDRYFTYCHKKESGLISTIETYDGVQRKESSITTPESMDLQKHFYNAISSGIEYMQVEVSSQALKYHRVHQVCFDTSIFLNISEDHISPVEHKDFEDYFTSKLQIFNQSRQVIINRDSEEFERVRQAATNVKKLITYGTHKDSDILVSNIRKVGKYTHFQVQLGTLKQEFTMKMQGNFNVENAVAAIVCAYYYQVPIEYIVEGVFHAHTKGRMECYTSKDENLVTIVDYAHNKLSFEKLFSCVKEEYPEYKVISIFGCPGEKAYNRRKQLGEIAGKYSDYVYIVADDPGRESYYEISSEIANALEEQSCPYELIEHRGEAARKAILESVGKTVVILAGKGHETSQKYGLARIHTQSDMEYAKQFLLEYEERGTMAPLRIAH